MQFLRHSHVDYTVYPHLATDIQSEKYVKNMKSTEIHVTILLFSLHFIYNMKKTILRNIRAREFEQSPLHIAIHELVVKPLGKVKSL